MKQKTCSLVILNLSPMLNVTPTIRDMKSKMNRQTYFQRRAYRADRIVGVCSAIISVVYVILTTQGMM